MKGDFIELTDNSYVFYCSAEPVSVLANWKIGTYGFAKDKFPFIVPFHKFNPEISVKVCITML